MKMKNMIWVILFSILLVSLAGCAAAPKGDAGSQPSGQDSGGQTSDQAGQTSDADILSKFYEMQAIREIMALHENIAENTVFYNSRGEEVLSVYQYADSETWVREDSNSSVDIQYQDSYYYYDPAESDKIQVFLGMEGVAETEWENRINDPFEFLPTEGEKLTEVIEADGRLVLTIVAEAKEEELPWWEEPIEPGTQTVFAIEVDSETYMPYDGEAYLKKPDGTELKLGEHHFSYDVAAYEPSEEILQVMSGTDNTITVVADPGTEREKTYVKSCGENGRLRVWFADGYEKLYLDEACTQESTPSDENGERTLYTVKRS